MTAPTRIRVILQARTSSSRLPAKVLLPVAGYPLVVLCAQRLGRGGLDVVVATSNTPSDDTLADVLARASICCYRGSLEDVLDRFAAAVADLDEQDILVRTTADNPVPDAAFVQDLVGFLELQDADYVGTSSPADGLPYGLSAEAMSVGALREANLQATSFFDREHVTPWIIRNLRTVPPDRHLWGLPDRSALRCTIDTSDDYERMQQAFSQFADDPIDTPWQRIVESVQALPCAPRFRIPFVVREGLAESVLALGTVQLGMRYGIGNVHGRPSTPESVAIVRSAVDHGVTWLDTAHAYGASERRIGRALRGSWRNRTKVITKLSPLSHLPNDALKECVKGLVDASVYRSLHALDVPRLDVLMLHRWRHRSSNDGAIWRRLLTLRDKGLIRELGTSLYQPEDAIAALSDPDVHHLQIPFNLLDRRWLSADFLDALRARPHIRIHVRSVFLQGLLLGDGSNWPAFDHDGPTRLEEIDRLVVALGRAGRADLCIAFVRAHPWVTSVVLGVETLDQLQQDLALACARPLTPEQATLVCDRLAEAPPRLLDPSQWPS
jgi:spore coat polysaccharide biosynthesis protein SpsF